MAKKNDSSEVVTKGLLRIEMQLQTRELKESFRDYIDAILTKIDPVLKEVMAAREEREIMQGSLDTHDKRISKLEHTPQPA